MSVHGDLYSYERCNYKTSRDKVVITCRKHGDFYQLPLRHTSGNGCKLCFDERRKSCKLLSTSDFILRSTEVHGDRYDYSKSIYTGGDNKITITCRTHGDFSQRAADHMQGHGCVGCMGDNSSAAYRKTKSQFMRESILIHGNKYDYSVVEYINAHHDVTIICPEHGEFKIRPLSHLDGMGCMSCKSDNDMIFYINSIDGGHIKFGITSNFKRRFRSQTRLSKLGMVNLFQFKFKNPNDCMNAERKIKSFTTPSLTKNEFLDGWTETTLENNIDMILEVIREYDTEEIYVNSD